LGAEYIQFIPIIERAIPETLEVADSGWGGHVKGRPLYAQTGEPVTHRSIGPEQYGWFMVDVFEEWVRRDIGRVYVRMFDTALPNWVGESAGICVHAETCGLQLALEHNGDLYCCDHFVEPDYLLANVAETPMQQLITSSKQWRPKDRFATSPYGEPGQHYLCPSYKAFLHHVDRPFSSRGACRAVASASVRSA